MPRLTAAAIGAATLLVLAGCSIFDRDPDAGPAPSPTPTPIVKRQLDAIAPTAEDYGPGWAVLPGEEGTGGGSELSDDEAAAIDPCAWYTEWLPSYDFFQADTWKILSAADDSSYAGHWILAAESGVDLTEVLEEYRTTLTACQPGIYEDELGQFHLTLIPDIGPELGDDSFSYRAEFRTVEGEYYGEGELHNFVCGPLWVQLSYVGNDPFVERDALLTLLETNAATLGGC